MAFAHITEPPETVVCDTGPLSEAYALAAVFANLDRIDDSGEPHTASFAEVVSFGARLLDLFGGVPQDGDWAKAVSA